MLPGSTRCRVRKTRTLIATRSSVAFFKVTITGNLEERHISTNYIERQNLTMRMSMRRFTRLTNAFAKKLDNHKADVAFYTMWYNFAWIHQTLRVTPAVEAGSSNHVWSVEEIARSAE